ncbi:MAG: dockerin type I repeat-containing protein [Euryarchaeota archaeon]|nr:dockerin type I repeat-containing protein [Euryarchaeota archaeon]
MCKLEMANAFCDYGGGGTSTDRFPLPTALLRLRFAFMQPWTGDTSQKGDLNYNGTITPADAAIALQLAATGAQNPAADVNDDGRITFLDALMIRKAAVGRIEL